MRCGVDGICKNLGLAPERFLSSLLRSKFYSMSTNERQVGQQSALSDRLLVRASTSGKPEIDIEDFAGCRQKRTDEEICIVSAIRNQIVKFHADTPKVYDELKKFVLGLIESHNKQIAQIYQEPTADRSDVSLGQKPLLKIRWTDGKGAIWGLDLIGTYGRYLNIYDRWKSQPSTPEPNVRDTRRGFLDRLHQILF